MQLVGTSVRDKITLLYIENDAKAMLMEAYKMNLADDLGFISVKILSDAIIQGWYGNNQQYTVYSTQSTGVVEYNSISAEG